MLENRGEKFRVFYDFLDHVSFLVVLSGEVGSHQGTKEKLSPLRGIPSGLADLHGPAGKKLLVVIGKDPDSRNARVRQFGMDRFVLVTLAVPGETMEEPQQIGRGNLLFEDQGGDAGKVQTFRQALDDLLPFSDEPVPVEKFVPYDPQEEPFSRFAVDPA